MNEKTQWASPDLQSLVDIFYQDPAALGTFQEVPGDQLPPDYRQLLDHNEHMTVTVEAHFASRVDVEVLAVHQTDTHYSRKILLRTQSERQVVQFGIVRINRSQLPASVMEQIESQAAPLGRILIENQFMRKVKRLSLWRIEAGEEMRLAFQSSDLASLQQQLGQKSQTAAQPPGGSTVQPTTCYGRTAFLYLDSLPVVELLEIVKV